MVFNSLDFLIFFIVVFVSFYYTTPKVRKLLLFFSSSVFYMWFVPVYILILYLTILIDYYAAIKIENANTAKRKKQHLFLGIINTCAVLFVFKYFNFFVDNLSYIAPNSIPSLSLLLPIGLSFHVFQSLSYVVDVYRGRQKAEYSLLNYANFVMFFPQLVAGPIERAQNLLPQLQRTDYQIKFSDFNVGFNRLLWGLFKKVVVADNIGAFVDVTYNNYTHHNGSTLLLGTLLFAIQIYTDFSGYSDMAIGVARMLGFRFMENFQLPYFSKTITEFWRRWHMSLSSWLRDYLYFSLGGNRRGRFNTYRNLMLTMLLGGLWHGASWNFVIWGALNGLYLCGEKIFGINKLVVKSRIKKVLSVTMVFFLISFTWVFFRAETFAQAIGIINKMFFEFDLRKIDFLNQGTFTNIVVSLAVLFLGEYFLLRKYSFDRLFFTEKRGRLNVAYASVIILMLIVFGNSDGNQFIYFQF